LLFGAAAAICCARVGGGTTTSGAVFFAAAVQTVGDSVGDMIGFFLGGLVGTRHVVVVAAGVGVVAVVVASGFPLDSGTLSLNDMRQLVCEKAIAFFRTGRKFAGAEMHIAFDRERASAELLGRRIRFAARMKTDRREIGT
jgi:hypothetical protein